MRRLSICEIACVELKLKPAVKLINWQFQQQVKRLNCQQAQEITNIDNQELVCWVVSDSGTCLQDYFIRAL